MPDNKLTELNGLPKEIWQAIASLLDYQDCFSLSITVKILHEWLSIEVARKALTMLRNVSISTQSENIALLDGLGRSWYSDSSTIKRYFKSIKGKQFITTELGYYLLDHSGQVWYDSIVRFSLKKIDVPPITQMIIASDRMSLFLLDQDGGVWQHLKTLEYSKLENLPPVKEIIVGRKDTFFLMKDGNVWGYGENKVGLLGLGHTLPVEIDNMQQIHLLSNIERIVFDHDASAYFYQRNGDIFVTGTNVIDWKSKQINICHIPTLLLSTPLLNIKQSFHALGIHYYLNEEDKLDIFVGPNVKHHPDSMPLINQLYKFETRKFTPTLYFMRVNGNQMWRIHPLLGKVEGVPQMHDATQLGKLTNNNPFWIDAYGNLNVMYPSHRFKTITNIWLQDQLAILKSFTLNELISLACSKNATNKIFYDALMVLMEAQLSDESMRFPILLLLQQSQWRDDRKLAQLLISPTMPNEKCHLKFDDNEHPIIKYSAIPNLLLDLYKHIYQKYMKDENSDRLKIFFTMLIKLGVGEITDKNNLKNYFCTFMQPKQKSHFTLFINPSDNELRLQEQIVNELGDANALTYLRNSAYLLCKSIGYHYRINPDNSLFKKALKEAFEEIEQPQAVAENNVGTMKFC